MDHDPARLIPAQYRTGKHEHGVKIDLNRPMKEILAELSKHPVSTPLLLTGTIVVGRDIAHAKFKEILDAGKPAARVPQEAPDLLRRPGQDAEGQGLRLLRPDHRRPHGLLRRPAPVARAASMVMIAKGNRSQQVTDACKKYGGFYLGSIGGPAAVLAEENIKKVECIDFPELGMEAVWKIEVVELPGVHPGGRQGERLLQEARDLKSCAFGREAVTGDLAGHGAGR